MSELTEQHRKTLARYLPEPVVEVVGEWIVRYGVHLTVTRHRQTKHGDFSPQKSGRMGMVTVNGSLNKYAFLLTFTHELAHYLVFKKYRQVIAPHGTEWKKMFRALYQELPDTSFPDDLRGPLASYMKNPKASSDRHTALSLALKRYDGPASADGECCVGTLASGSVFLYGKDREFTVVEKRRRLYLCRETRTNKQYLFQPHATVRLLTLTKQTDEN